MNPTLGFVEPSFVGLARRAECTYAHTVDSAASGLFHQFMAFFDALGIATINLIKQTLSKSGLALLLFLQSSCASHDPGPSLAYTQHSCIFAQYSNLFIGFAGIALICALVSIYILARIVNAEYNELKKSKNCTHSNTIVGS